MGIRKTHTHADFYFFKNTHNNFAAYLTLMNTHIDNMHVRKANTRMFAWTAYNGLSPPRAELSVTYYYCL